MHKILRILDRAGSKATEGSIKGYVKRNLALYCLIPKRVLAALSLRWLFFSVVIM